VAPLLTASAPAGATTITVDSVAEFPTAPQFEIAVGSERAIVLDLSGLTLTLVAPLAIAHRKGQSVGYVNRDANDARAEITGEVTLGDTGLRLVGTDNVDNLRSSAVGFAGGSYDDRIESGGIYNARFAQGSTTDMAASDGGSEADTTAEYQAAIDASDLPGWAINASPGVLKVISDATIYGGTALESAGNSNGDVNVIYQDIPLYSADPQQIELHVYRNGSGAATMQIVATWRDDDHGLLGSATTGPVDLSAASTATYIRQILKESSQVQARYLRIKLVFTHTTTPRVIRVGALKRPISSAWPVFAGIPSVHAIIFRHQPDGTGWGADGLSGYFGVDGIDNDAALLDNAFLKIRRTNAGDTVLMTRDRAGGAGTLDWLMQRDGRMEWGSAGDVALLRASAGLLQVDPDLDVVDALTAATVEAAGAVTGNSFQVSQTGGGQGLNLQDNYILFDDIGGGTEPTNPGSAGQVKLYARVNGSGKTEIRARFDTGAFVTIATEP
jgi:hypothetical protein